MGAVFRPVGARVNSTTVDPTTAADAGAGYRVGDMWFNTATGNAFYATDVSSGAAVWRHIPRNLGSSAVAASAPANTSENILATITIPAGAMGLNGILRILAVWTCTNNANVKTVRARFSGIGGTIFATGSMASSVSLRQFTQFANRGVANSQVGGSSAHNVQFTTTTNAAITASVDTSAVTTIVLTAEKATAGDTLTLESYLVELILP